jgi:hypothetical protein
MTREVRPTPGATGVSPVPRQVARGTGQIQCDGSPVVFRPILALAAVAWLALLAGVCPTAAAQSKPAPSLDEELLRQLRSKSVDDLDRELFGPQQTKPGEKRPPAGPKQEPKPGDDLDQELRRELGSAGVSQPDDDNPLLSVARQMREAEALIAKARSGPPTQQVQKQIVADLDKLIQEARKSCGKCAGATAQPQNTASTGPVKQPSKQPGSAGSPGKPNAKPATESNAKPGHAEPKRPDVEAARGMVRDLWGMLPEHDREMMVQLPLEEFLPKYEPLIIEYFRRLSEEQAKKSEK